MTRVSEAMEEDDSGRVLRMTRTGLLHCTRVLCNIT